MIKGYVVGTVKFTPKLVSPEGKSKFMSIIVESVRSYNGKEYRSSVDVAVYGKSIDDAAKIPLGALVCAEGDMSARPSQYQGKTYANLKMIGEVVMLRPPVSMQPVAVTEKPDESDDVPF